MKSCPPGKPPFHIDYNYQPSYPSVSDNEEYGYEICPSGEVTRPNLTTNSKPPSRSETDPSPSMLEKLKQKVALQAKRLTELQIYKALCEKHILQLSPNHQLPITEEHITNFNADNYTNKTIQQLMHEKEQICESLRSETLINEEQRNYIEILKQTIESSIIKSGLGNAVNKGMKAVGCESGVDFVSEFAKMKTENEKIKKDLIMQQAVFSELKSEFETIKKQNDDYAIKCEKMQNEIEKANKAYNEASQMKVECENANKSIKNENIYLCEENAKLKEKLNECEKEIENNKSELNDLRGVKLKYEKMLIVNEKKENEISELTTQLDFANKSIQDTKEENAKYANITEMQKNEIAKLKDILTEAKIKNENLINNKNDLQTSMLKSEKTHIELNNQIEVKNKEIENMRNIINSNEKEIAKLNNINANFKNKSEYTNQNLKNANIEIEQLKYLLSEEKRMNSTNLFEIEKLKNKNEDNEEKIDNMRIELDNKDKQIDELHSQIADFDIELSKLSNEYEKVKNANITSNNEIKFWKSKCETDTQSKANEVKILKSELTNLRYKIEDLTREYKKAINENTNMKQEIENAEIRESKLRNEFNELKGINANITKSLNQHLNDLKREVHTSYDINAKNNAMTIQLNELISETNRLKNENSSYENCNNALQRQIEEFRALIKEKEIELYSMEKAKNNTAKNINICYNTIIDFISKENANINDSNRKLYMNSLSDFVASLSSAETTGEKTKIISDFVTAITTQAEIVYDLFL